MSATPEVEHSYLHIPAQLCACHLHVCMCLVLGKHQVENENGHKPNHMPGEYFILLDSAGERRNVFMPFDINTEMGRFLYSKKGLPTFISGLQKAKAQCLCKYTSSLE